MGAGSAALVWMGASNAVTVWMGAGRAALAWMGAKAVHWIRCDRLVDACRASRASRRLKETRGSLPQA